jgi:hypothetical protein
MPSATSPRTRGGTKSGDQPAPTERITVGLIARVAEELRRLRVRTGLSKADLINRSVSLYSYIDSRMAAGDELLIRSAETGEIERIKLF